VGQHVRLPRPGVALHINAFNFPAWGTFEKIAVALLAGVPVVSKPASSTALLAWRMVQIVVEAGILPPGALSFVAGAPGDLLDHLGPQDMIAFTGSADTAARLRGIPAVREWGARLNVEADSLNAAVLGPDVSPGSEMWHLALRNIARDMTQKTGQKCTAVRRIFAPEDLADELREALCEELGRVVVGNPADDGVGMGPVATANQLRDGRAGIELLAGEGRVVTGGAGAIAERGYFIAPTLIEIADGASASRVHQHEVFGPCASLIRYDGGAARAAELVARGQGCLVSSVYADDRDWLTEFLFAAAPWNGRVVVGSEKVADQVLPPGMVLPNQVHGGPGRAGGGEELGGLRGLEHYTQRVALQGDAGLLRKILE
jgi:oxepin-CoA hydrolase/3-oxo-5,6-dehydrosuberyl-CoA semialdehyde dehydrogenase